MFNKLLALAAPRVSRPALNTKTKLLILAGLAGTYLTVVFFWGLFMPPELYAVRYADKFIAPGTEHLFGTDFMGRDMFYRSIKGLSTSLVIGLIASAVSSVIGLILGIASALLGGKFDKFVSWLVDCCIGLPHLVLLILISFMLGRGAKGVMIGVALTHWPELTRLVRAEVLQLRSSQYIQAAYKLGRSRLQVAREHIVPHVLPVYLVGLVLLFPHAIMHEAAITFLGFGLPAESPAIGVILSEAMKHISTGKWWLALFPGLMLLIAVILFDVIGDNLKKLLNPNSGNE
ncbi:binding-protein-dependent transport systems inner membrane component [Syntrophobotulus glycolicus DSM 8271]|uniref:Binding-protein-dependent transport systems inner membrane component n=1 Tax=Syntrophobotulus glycolicus (strain DSM 8271 / FlGlyR) TaxID=645991 RepID=F0SVR9_SYNGF|nr:ABC transporter permease [Syntrophobotulus glycolicus]ADY55625.1 binding-protein-dependent transport systems inner membrane component [Syntrophobotulus glycolicus DSM 8271]